MTALSKGSYLKTVFQVRNARLQMFSPRVEAAQISSAHHAQLWGPIFGHTHPPTEHFNSRGPALQTGLHAVSCHQNRSSRAPGKKMALFISATKRQVK